jgi:hypothetical protein
MEELIGIIVAVAVLIFKVIAKKMNDSADKPADRPARPEPMRQYKTLEEVFPELSYDYVEDALGPKMIQVEVPKDAPKEDVGHQVGCKSTPVVIDEETSKDSEKKEKIDPKKLIVYSEIMNRKY